VTFHKEMMQIITGYTAVGVFVATAIITLLSLVGKARFVNGSQQKVLFSLLIVEIAAISVSSFAGLMRFDTAEVAESIQDKGRVEVTDRLGVSVMRFTDEDIVQDMLTDITENTSKYFSREQSVNDRIEIFSNELTNQLSKTLEVTEQKGIEQGIAILGHEFAVFIREIPIVHSGEFRDLLNNLATRLDEMNSIDDVAEFAEFGKNFTSQFTEYVTEIENRAIQQSFEAFYGVLENMVERLPERPEQIDTLTNYVNDMRSFEEPQFLERGTNLFERLESFTNESEKLFR